MHSQHCTRTLRVVGASVCALLINPLAAYAQTTPTIDLGKLSVVGLMPSASLTWQTDPSAADTLSGSDAADYLQTIPGFSRIRNGGSNSDPVLRGQFGSRLNLVSNDGHMNGACPARMDNTLSYISAEAFDQLLVIKGPQSVLWGPGGSAGTVIFRRELKSLPGETHQLSGSVLYGSNQRIDAALNALIGDGRGYMRLDAQRSRSDDYRDGNGDVVPSRWDKYGVDATLGLTPSAATQIELSAGQGNGQARYAGRGMDGSQFLRTSAGVRMRHQREHGALREIEFNAYRTVADHIMDNFSMRSPNPHSAMPMPMSSNVRTRNSGGRLALQWLLGPAHVWTGVDWQRTLHDGRNAMGAVLPSTLPWKDDASQTQTGLFTQVHIPSGMNQWVIGARVDHASARDERRTVGMMNMRNPTYGMERTETLTSGFARLERHLSPQVTAYVGVGHSERMPDYWELFSPNRGPVGTANAFAGVQPERTTQLDIGAQRNTRNGSQWISAYAGTIADYIVTDYVSGGMMGMTTQAHNARAQIAGAELGFRQRLNPALQVSGSAAFAWGRNTSQDRPLPQMPPLDIRLGADYTHRAWTFGGQLRGVAKQSRVALNQGTIVGRDLGPSAGFATVALQAAYRVTPQWQIAAGVDNLLDRTYAEHLNLSGSADFGFPADPVRINEPGRTLWLRVSRMR